MKIKYLLWMMWMLPLLFAVSFTARGVDVTDNYAAGDTLTVGTMNNIKTAVNSKLDDATGAVNSGHISNEAGVEYYGMNGIGLRHDVQSNWTVVRTLTVTSPSNGYVVCTATGSIWVSDSSSSAYVYVGWDLNNTSGVAPDSYVVFRNVSGSYMIVPFTAMRTYFVGRGVYTFSVKADTSSSDNTDFDLYESSSACIFVPTRY
jgi:hypothetical protein